MFDRIGGACSTPKKVKATDAPTPEGEHLLRVYQRSRGHKPNDCWCSCDDVVWSGYYYYFPPLGGLLLTLWRVEGREEGVIEGDPRIPELSKGPIKGPLTCIPGFFKWPWPQVVEKAPN